MTSATSSPTALYRLYDAEDQLLYIGISGDPPSRFKQHAKLQPWWFQVHRHAEHWFNSRRDAELAEIEAIRAELPRWNREWMPSTKICQDVMTPPPRQETEDERRVAEIRTLAEQIAERDRLNALDKARMFELIPLVFPEKHGGEKVRGRLNAVVAASGYTREYVARIRDGKVKP